MRATITFTFLLISSVFYAQNFTTWGTEFYIPNSNGQLVMETGQATDVTIENLANGATVTYSYQGNSNELIDMRENSSNYYSLEPYFNFNVIGQAIRVTSIEPINLRYSIEKQTFGGSSMILPTNMLGTDYTLSTHRVDGIHTWLMTSFTPMFFVTATEDNTTLELMLTEPTANGFPVNTPFNVTLNEGEILQIRGVNCSQDSPITGCYSVSGVLIEKDFSGSTITSVSECAPISVHCFTSGYSNYLPTYGAGACCSDRMMEQFLPHNFWGNEYYVIPEQHISHGNMFEVFSRFDNNQVFIDGYPIITLNANETFDTLLMDPAYIKTPKQSFVSHFFLSQESSGPSGSNLITIPSDPEMIYVLPIEYQSSGGNFGFPSSLYEETSTKQWLSIVTKNENVGNIVLDGSPVSASSFTPFSSISPYSWAYLDISELDHEVYSTDGPFQSMIIGNCNYGSRVSYVGIDDFAEQSNPIYYAEIICFENEQITLEVPQSGTNVLWSTGETSNSIVVTEPGVYWVESTDSCGFQEFSQSFLITYDCDPLIAPDSPNADNCVPEFEEAPNVFTPNGDLINDEFVYSVPACLSEPRFTVLNRWGEVVFETTNPNVVWDGEVGGIPASEGTYFWALQGKDSEGDLVKKTGFFTIAK